MTTPDEHIELDLEAPDADVLEQHQTPTGLDDTDDDRSDLPAEADPADVAEQRRAVGGDDYDDYR